MKPTLLTAAVLVLGLSSTTYAQAQEQPQPQPPTPPPATQPAPPTGQPSASPQPLPQPMQPMQPMQPQPQAPSAQGQLQLQTTPIGATGSSSSSGSVSGAEVSGFHVALGGGLSGHDTAGIAASLRVGYRMNEKMRVFVQYLHHWYATVAKETLSDGGLQTTVEWRSSMMHGVGLDYYILPHVALRGAIGLGSDAKNFYGEKIAVGYSFLMGMSLDVVNEGDHHLTIDPYIHMLQHNRANLQPDTGNQWVSRPIIGVTANYSFH